jgi:O-antigen/teichoic acid export membrane protein
MSQLKKGAFLSTLTIVLTTGIGLVLTPFMIRQLGDDEYSLYTLVGSLIASISVFDFGLNNTILRFVAKYRAEQDRRGEENFLATTMLIYILISTIIVIIGIGIFINLESIFHKLKPAEMEKAKIMFGILILNLAVTLPGGAFAAVSSAYEHFVFPRALNIVKYVTRSVLLVAVLLLGGDSVSIVVLDTVVNLLVIGVNGFYIYRALRVRFRLHSFRKSHVLEIFGYSVWIFIFAMVGQFQWTSGQVILGVINPKVVGIYGVGIMLGTYYGAFSTAISGVFLPRATKMTVLGASGAELTAMMIRIGRFSLIVLLCILGGFALYGRQFVDLWVGPTYYDSWLIALIVMFAYTLPLTQAFANSILEARSKFSFKAVTYISLIALGTAAGAWLATSYGAVGIIAGSTVGWLVGQVIMNWYYHTKIGLQIPRFFGALCHRLLPTFVVILVIGAAINLIPGRDWFNLILKIALFAIVFAGLMLRFGMNKEEISVFTGVVPFLPKRRES